MACGFNIETLKKLQALEQASTASIEEEDELGNLKKLVQSKAAVREKAKDQLKNEYDWTRTYSHWSTWAEEEEMKEKIDQIQKKEEAARNRQKIGGCSHNHSAERELVNKTTQTKLEECREFRTFGNAWFEEGQYFRASERYRKIEIWMDYTFPSDDQEKKRMDEILLPALVNLSVCFLKLKQYKEVINTAKRALRLDETNLKAYYCLAKAYRKLDDFTQASTSISTALKLGPNSVPVRMEFAKLQNQKQRYRELSMHRAQAMFDK
mmetsp:Transcript_583/g.681  ORF Transcript_583/g.681 Transcript_583/m.681 type:complete len:266 (+) Transcript_583:38-835(+)